MRLVSWNVNGLRAVLGRGDLAWAFSGDVDVMCLQETKIQADAVTDEMKSPPGFKSWWSFGKKKGYSGTAIFVRDTMAAEPFPFKIGREDHPEFDDEGRIVGVDLGAFVLLNIYFPNGGSGDDRLVYKHAWHERFLEEIIELKKVRSVVVCGDFNIGHRPIDVALPEKWARVSGFLPEERAWFDRMLAAGFIDTFRAEKGDLPRQFTFWETRVEARNDNLGWRIDYFVVSQDLEEQILDAWISPQIFGSDHCPVGLELDVKAGVAAAVDEEWQMQDEAEVEQEEDDAGGRRR